VRRRECKRIDKCVRKTNNLQDSRTRHRDLELFHVPESHTSKVPRFGGWCRNQRKIDWDGPNMKATNCPEADAWITREFRKEWAPR